MILINEMKLKNQTIELIGQDLNIKRYYDEDYYDYLDRIVEGLRISVGEEEPQ